MNAMSASMSVSSLLPQIVMEILPVLFFLFRCLVSQHDVTMMFFHISFAAKHTDPQRQGLKLQKQLLYSLE